MDAIALHLEVRNALSLSDELGRDEHALGHDTFAGHLAALKTSLLELEKTMGVSHAHPVVPSPVLLETLSSLENRLREHADELSMTLRPRFGLLLETLERIVFAEMRPTALVPSKPLFGKLPLRRVLPQNAHSIADYVASAVFFASAGVARTRRGRFMGIALGAKLAGVSLLTDYKLSAAKVIPIEMHEAFDHAIGASAIAAPFALGYVRRDPICAALQIAMGIGSIARALLTDYRAVKGIGGARRSNGQSTERNVRRTQMLPTLLRFFGATRKKHTYVSDVQRPLEGLSASDVPLSANL